MRSCSSVLFVVALEQIGLDLHEYGEQLRIDGLAHLFAKVSITGGNESDGCLVERILR